MGHLMASPNIAGIFDVIGKDIDTEYMKLGECLFPTYKRTIKETEKIYRMSNVDYHVVFEF